ncbi:phospholipid-transporting ATPase ABCA3-like isoform X1 [Monodelphis domestica]|uniref:phospholipid-transporting ATPase ABCA3-like isoform X1 n=1 Tax=Monodelphis domestica TaxID=13616 RepID=UPI0024E2198C|nr:phospholipid-transporting ATPase ABCA3-like isoform X1 [Monodelphis domestica]
MGKFQQFKLLLWKNFLFMKQIWHFIVLEVLMSSVFALLIVFFRSVELEKTTEPSRYNSFTVNRLPRILEIYRSNDSWKLFYVPSKSDAVKTIIGSVQSTLRSLRVKGFDSEMDFHDYIFSGVNSSLLLAVVVFHHNFDDEKDPLPLKVSYTLRFSPISKISRVANTWYTQTLFRPTEEKLIHSAAITQYGGLPGYYFEGFLTVQYAVDHAIIQYHRRNTVKDKSNITSFVFIKRFQNRAIKTDHFFLIFKYFFSIIILLAFSSPVLGAIRFIVSEKENKCKEYLLMMGLSKFLLWSTYFFTFFIRCLLVIFLQILIFFYKITHLPVIRFSDKFLIFVFLICFALACVNFSFMISTFFNKSKLASSVGVLVYFFSFIPYRYVHKSYRKLTLTKKLIPCLVSNVAMSLGAELIVEAEMKGTGLHWNGLWHPVIIEDNLAFIHILGMLLFDSFVYALVTWYTEAVFPGDYGISHPWNFFLMPSYWFGTLNSKIVVDEESQEVEDNDYIEADPVGLTPGIQIKHLNKVFTKGHITKMAVNDLTLNFYENQITVLLGQNGAGKTTTMSILTGMLCATSGKAYIYGHEISKEFDQIRKSLSFCPQHDILFDYMTVYDHLYFFAQIKGMSRETCHQKITNILKMVKLEEKQNEFSKTLSGGMKRKLSISIALIGDSKVVILDEPTSGMDPFSRRTIWNLIEEFKRDHTILLTTHYMDEADMLGDRIAIMANGTLQCCGSSLFLKHRYGAGYHMIIVKDSNCDVDKIFNIIQEYVPSATLESNTGAELSFILPKESTNRFEALFIRLENEQVDLGISSYGVSVTTMEEVFLRVGQLADSNIRLGSFQKLSSLQNRRSKKKEKETVDSREKESHDLPESLIKPVYSTLTHNTGCNLYYQQVYAMFIKRAIYSWRNWKTTLMHLVLPPLYIYLMLTAFSSPKVEDEPSMKLDLSLYEQNIVPFSMSGNLSVTQKIFKSVESLLKPQGHILKEVKGNLDEFLRNRKFSPKKCIIAFSVNVTGSYIVATALFNNEAYHSTAISLAMVDNILFMFFCGPKASITVSNKPLPNKPRNATTESLGSDHGYEFALTVIFGMAALSSGFSREPVIERVTKVKHMQFVHGAYVLIFWLSALVWDFIFFFIVCLMFVALFKAFVLEIFSEVLHFSFGFLIFALHGWSVIPLIYLMSCFFSQGSSAEMYLFLFNVFSVMISMSLLYMIKAKVINLKSYSDITSSSFLLLPSHSLGMSIQRFYENFKISKKCAISGGTHCSDKYAAKDFFGWNDTGNAEFLVAMAASGFFYLLLLCLIEKYFWRVRNCCTHLLYWFYPMWQQHTLQQLNQNKDQEKSEDEDVENEKKKIQECPSDMLPSLNSPLIIKGLLKVYFKWIPVLAVDRLFLSVQKGECFGLLGFNGAGKTSTFKMLTGDETITSGDAFFENYSILKDIGKVRQRISYCPQFDALLDYMTSKEMLTLYARLRGIPEPSINEHVIEMLQSLLLEDYSDKITKTYSGGTKRKLSTGIALVGNPSIIFLDEPSTGMDPLSRRLLWNTIIRTRDSGKAIVITSHSMEECEALCTRVAIMVNGKFRCLGSLQHLKKKFSKGYTLLVKLKRDYKESEVEHFKQFMKEIFPGINLLQQYHGMIRYSIPNENQSWAKVFGVLEEVKVLYNLEDYSISQTTLEQIFLGFANPEDLVNE